MNETFTFSLSHTTSLASSVYFALTEHLSLGWPHHPAHQPHVHGGYLTGSADPEGSFFAGGGSQRGNQALGLKMLLERIPIFKNVSVHH